MLLPVFKHGFFRSEENVNLNNIPTLDVNECWCVLQFVWILLYKLAKTWQMLCHSVLKADGMPLADVIVI